MDYNGKVVVITGGSGGIGRHMVEAFVREGAKVINIDKVPFLESQNTNEDYRACDLTKVDEIVSAIAYIRDTYSQVDVLINNACYSAHGIISECTPAQFNDVLMVGVTAPYILTSGLLTHFSKGASIVNIASTRGFMSQSDTESYSAAKGGILALTHALSISLAGRVRVNAISPGWIHTSSDWSEVSDIDHAQHPAKRVGTPEDIVRTVMFLCDSDNSFITGENITVDGGMSKLMIYHNDHGWTFDPPKETR